MPSITNASLFAADGDSLLNLLMEVAESDVKLTFGPRTPVATAKWQQQRVATT